MNNNKGILMVSNMYPDIKHPSYGIFVKKFCDQLDLNGIKYSLSVMHKADSKVWKITGYIFFYISTFFRVLFGNYDLIYVHYPSFSGGPVYFATKIRRRNIYTNLHGSDVVPENLMHEKMQKYTVGLLAESKKVIVPSEYFKELVSKKYRLKKETIFVYPSGGIDRKIFSRRDERQVAKFKKQYGIENEYPIFGMAGRISKDKGWDVFVEAANSIQANANFIIVGTGNEDGMLEKKIEKEKSNIIWVKKLLSQNELALFYSACDFFVFPTKRKGESLGLVAVEAMACATPVIASNYAAPMYYVKDGVNGFKVPMGDSKALTEIINKVIILNCEAKRSLSEGALKTAEHYFCENLNENFKKIFE